MDRSPKTLLEAVTYFADADRAHAFAVKQRWPNGVACPRQGCGNADVVFISTRKLWRCKECKRQFSVKVGTIFEDSPIPLTKWLPAVWLLTNTKNGTSSCELARSIGVTQKTAWFMFHRIRAAMKTPTAERLRGEVEVDETYVGGSAEFRRGNRGTSFRDKDHGIKHPGPRGSKTPVLGLIQRASETSTSRVRAMVVPNSRRLTLMPKITEHVERGTVVYTDAWRAYTDVCIDYYHEVIDHTIRYVEGRVHTNTIENFWSCLKRTLKGTYIAARPFHLDAYLDEQVFRFNERGRDDGGRFALALKGTDGRRLTYKELIAARNP
jgi:transposase-like protein